MPRGTTGTKRDGETDARRAVRQGSSRPSELLRLVLLKKNVHDTPPSHDVRVDARHGDDASSSASARRG